MSEIDSTEHEETWNNETDTISITPFDLKGETISMAVIGTRTHIEDLGLGNDAEWPCCMLLLTCLV